MSGVEELKQLSDREINQLETMVSDPRFTVDVARSDGKLRRLEASMRITDRAGGGSLRFSVRFENVDEPVTIDAPSSGQPIAELGRKLRKDFGAPAAGDAATRS